VDVNVPVDEALERAVVAAAEGDPAVDAIELDVQRLAVSGYRLGMAAPAVDELMAAGGDPFVVEHAGKIQPGGARCTPPGY
jgi:hypothetical protein